MALGHPNHRWFRLGHRYWHPYAPLVAALGLGVAASHCSTPSSDTPSSKPVPPGSTPTPLEVHFDARIRRVSVAIGVPVNAETKAVVRVRKGTLKLDGLETLNCGELEAGTAALDLRTPVAGDGADGVLTYDGPVVPESYKAQYYDDDSNEIGPDATPEQLAAIAAGTDPIVEGCLWQGSQVIGKVQLSLFRAWDKATPDLVKKAMAYERGEALGVAPSIQSVTTYGELCEAELGEIPFFPKREDGSRATYDCTKDPRSVTVPITVMNGQGVEELQAVEPPKCDRPDWLRGSCAPFTRVQRDINKEGTRWVLLCRKPEPGQGKDGTHFNDIALIGHNPKTGKACFFQNGLYGKTDGAHIASPADPQRAEATWSAFSAAKCNACHDDDPFNHSPWVDQAKYPDGRFVVPRMGDDPDYALGVLAKYRLVGMRTKQWYMRPALEPTAESAPCTGCHRFGLGNAVTGEQTSASWVERAFGTDADFNENRVTPAFLVAKRQEWMPELHGGQVLSKEQRDAYDRAVKSLVKCGLEESSCATKPFESSF